jgi:hypothetical protein
LAEAEKTITFGDKMSMDFRTSGATGRTASAPAARPVNGRPAAPAGSHINHSGQKKRKLPTLIVGIVLLIVLVLFGAWFAYQSKNPSYINGGKYQAVFFTNGQVYFGKLEKLDDGYMKLTKVFYLQSKTTATDDSKNPQDAASQKSSDVELIKLGSEIHGPDDEMIISRDQVLFFENLKKDGTVTDSISKYFAQKH